jgi:hypothetical protein
MYALKILIESDAFANGTETISHPTSKRALAPVTYANNVHLLRSAKYGAPIQ